MIIYAPFSFDDLATGACKKKQWLKKKLGKKQNKTKDTARIINYYFELIAIAGVVEFYEINGKKLDQS